MTSSRDPRPEDFELPHEEDDAGSQSTAGKPSSPERSNARGKRLPLNQSSSPDADPDLPHSTPERLSKSVRHTTAKDDQRAVADEEIQNTDTSQPNAASALRRPRARPTAVGMTGWILALLMGVIAFLLWNDTRQERRDVASIGDQLTKANNRITTLEIQANQSTACRDNLHRLQVRNAKFRQSLESKSWWWTSDVIDLFDNAGDENK